MRTKPLIILGAVFGLIAGAETRTIPLTPGGMKLINVKAEPATYKGRTAVRITDAGSKDLRDGSRMAILSGTEFQDGSIEVDLAGDTLPGSPPAYRAFTGIAFRVAGDGGRYECLYLRPKNGRSEDQEQRNHSVQYISFPEFPWQRSRKEFPSKYETYADLVPGDWTKVKIEVRGDKARLWVHGAEQATLVVNDLKHGVSKGAIALWIDVGTVAHFSNLKVTQ